VSQTKQWDADKGLAVRDGPNQGAGGSQRLYVGKHGGRQYTSYLRVALDWTDVGKIVSAVLTIFTDDGLGAMPSTNSESPKVTLRRLTESFSEGSDNSAFISGDFDTAAATTSDERTKVSVTRAEDGANNIDITAFAEDWAPATVKRRNGTGGGKAANHGIKLIGTGDTNENIGFWSEDASDSAKRPYVTLTFEYGPTVPSTPTNLSPSGVVASVGSFEGDFADVRATDKLARSHVQVIRSSHIKTGDADLDNTIDVTAHGYAVGKEVWFTSLTGGAGLSTTRPYYVRSVVNANSFTVTLTPGGTVVDITTAYSALSVVAPIYSVTQSESNAAIVAERFDHIPAASLALTPGVTYQWRARVYDNEGQVSAFTSFTNFSVTNTDPNAPVLTPVNASSYATLDAVMFRGTFTDPDVGDRLFGYQVQMSAYAEGDEHWLDDEFILWNTGRRPVTLGATSFETPYGGAELDAGTYYWRARVWDNENGVSDWEYASIVLTAGFEPEPGTQTQVQYRPRAPWRIVIRDMMEADGVTRKAGRGPGNIVAVLEDAKNPGATKLYNSPGEFHFTLPADHPQLSVIEPKQTHYSVQFRQGDGWRETYQGLMWDFDATDTDIVFYGLDHMALLDYLADERYDPSNPDKPAEKGGSKYVTSGKNTINYIVDDQLDRAKALANSPVGFIDVGSIATMDETVVVYSTYAGTLEFVSSLIDSHRSGTGKRTRLHSRQKTGGGYEWVVEDDPGSVKDNITLRYGELVQGYRVIPFGQDWSSRVNAIGRARDGIRVMYKTQLAPGIDESVWGHFARTKIIDGVSDENDLNRRTKQAARTAGKLGKQIAVGIRTGALYPFDGFDICDQVPVSIEDGSVSTDAFGSGYWVILGVTWTFDSATKRQNITLTLAPREDSEAPDTDLLLLQPISPQAEWQIGWTAPNPLVVTARYWLDQTTGIVYERGAGDELVSTITGDV
jgi:hypothetical protein